MESKLDKKTGKSALVIAGISGAALAVYLLWRAKQKEAEEGGNGENGEGGEPLPTYTCAACGQVFNSPELLTEHENLVHSTPPVIPPVIPTPTIINMDNLQVKSWLEATGYEIRYSDSDWTQASEMYKLRPLVLINDFGEFKVSGYHCPHIEAIGLAGYAVAYSENRLTPKVVIDSQHRYAIIPIDISYVSASTIEYNFAFLIIS